MPYASQHFDCTWDFAGQARDGRTLARCREHGVTLAMRRSTVPLPPRPTLTEDRPLLRCEDLDLDHDYDPRTNTCIFCAAVMREIEA
jgi:hypothetical protein